MVLHIFNMFSMRSGTLNSKVGDYAGYECVSSNAFNAIGDEFLQILLTKCVGNVDLLNRVVTPSEGTVLKAPPRPTS